MDILADIVEGFIRNNAVQDKIDIRKAYAPARVVADSNVALGDDCAAIKEADGSFLLIAAEGLLDSFVRDDPWFAGYSAVMVNISDVCAMGGRPTAIVDVIWTPDYEHSQEVWAGMRRAAEDYGVPVVGGHTTITRNKAGVHLAAAIVGRAQRLMTSFDARPDDHLLMVVDLNGGYRGEKPFWNATLSTSSSVLRKNMELLPRIAESGLCVAAKDISNGGVIGTLIMLLECSGVGAELVLDEIPIPPSVDLQKWLVSFPSFGYLLSVQTDKVADVTKLFTDHGLACGSVGRIDDSSSLTLQYRSERLDFWHQPVAA
jgi:AIR synthase-related protein